MKILVTPTSFKPDAKTPAMEKLRGFSNQLVFNPYARPMTAEETIPLLEGCEGYLAGLDYITEEVIASAAGLRVISRYGAGVDRVDLAAAAQHNITVANTPGANAQAVAELAFGLALACARKIPFLDKQTRQNNWVRSTGTELAGKTIGIVGLGAIGRKLARMAQGFSMNVTAYDPFVADDVAKALGISLCPLEKLVAAADVISLHLPLNGQTKHIIGREAMARMKPGVILINTSRGGLIDEEAVCEMLDSGQVGGLGLDVYEKEPPENSPLFKYEQVVFTPHTGAHTKEAIANMADTAVQNLIDLLSGQPCQNIIAAR